MTHPEGFATLIAAVRRGDADAAARLVQRYENELRTIARVKLNDPRLRRLVDSMDICQSVLGNFFFRAAAGQFDIESPEDLLRLLGQMVRNKVTDLARQQFAERRDQGRVADVGVSDLAVRVEQDTPSQVASAKELAEGVRLRLSPEECPLVQRRMEGFGWDEIAAEFDIKPEALRKKVTRALNRVAAELGLEQVE